MKKTSIQISIPTPCHESWDQMDTTAHGAFCHSCQREVIDFTAMTDREVVEYLQKHKTGCGRLRKDQLDTPLILPVLDNGLFKWKAMFIGLLPILSANNIVAAPATLAQTSQFSGSEDSKTDTIPVSPAGHSINIQGKILDEKNEGVIGASILVVDSAGKTNGMGAAADFDGNFSIEFPSGFDIAKWHQFKISSIGYKTRTIRISDQPKQDYKVVLEIENIQNISMVGGLSFRTTPAQRIRNFFRYIFHSHRHR